MVIIGARPYEVKRTINKEVFRLEPLHPHLCVHRHTRDLGACTRDLGTSKFPLDVYTGCQNFYINGWICNTQINLADRSFVPKHRLVKSYWFLDMDEFWWFLEMEIFIKRFFFCGRSLQFQRLVTECDLNFSVTRVLHAAVSAKSALTAWLWNLELRHTVLDLSSIPTAMSAS